MINLATIGTFTFGHLPDGRPVKAFRLTNQTGARAVILAYGGILQSFGTLDVAEKFDNLALGFHSLPAYLNQTRYFGAVIGRHAGRIPNGIFYLDDKEYRVPLNSPPHSKHGGFSGFDKKLWSAESFRTSNSSCVRLEYTSADGEEGYPGELRTAVTYRLLDHEDTLRVEYEATTDQPTIVSLTNHSYFNLAGEGNGSILDHELRLNADHYLPIGKDLNPLAGLAPVAGTSLDFTSPHRIGERIRDDSDQMRWGRGYDHNFAVNGEPSAINFAARVVEPTSRRTLELWTTEPDLVFYTANLLDGSIVGTSGRAYRSADGFALEPKRFSDPKHRPNFPGNVLRPGDTYLSTTEYRFARVPIDLDLWNESR
ncbi:aldose epimerase family protein [Cryobacterium aureum]|uniref:aldose epimerase family protein n=1 Tax=Cryobacterium aureum TaxID=995037 RepID=UPI000CF4666E|nr:aldose epimerase family protein [Cryobacterium aureum]